jgi:hypothetical protein
MTAAQGCKAAFFALLFSQLFTATYYPMLADSPQMRLGAALAGGLLALAWARLDARARGIELGTGMGVGLVLLAAVFVPAWLLQTRPPQQAWQALGRFLLWLVLLAVGFSFGAGALDQAGIAPLPRAATGGAG